MVVIAMVVQTILSSTSVFGAASVTLQPSTTDTLVNQNVLDPSDAPQLTEGEMAKLVRQKIKYVFVIFNENNSFDHEYGTFPGTNNLYSTGMVPRSAADTPGFLQTYVDRSSGQTVSVTPFLLGPHQNATVIDSVDHNHKGLAKKLAVGPDGVARMTGFAQDEYDTKAGTNPSKDSAALGRQYANIVMSHIDCDTIPFFWQYANRFTIFDNIFATEDTPSTPNAIAMIAGQGGETQWVKHGPAGTTGPLSGTINGVAYNGQTGTTQGPPLLEDPQPFYGSEYDTTTKNRQPNGPNEKYKPSNIASNMTFASVPLTAMGGKIGEILAGDQNPATNQADIQNDISTIASRGGAQVQWRWYENGYDHEPSDPDAPATHNNYVTHHDGPAYFGYIANNDSQVQNRRGEGDFFDDIESDHLPPQGGVFYIRGGYGNLQKLKTPITAPDYPRTLTRSDIDTVQAAKAGDDDHPAYSDRQITEAMNARVINAIANNPKIWSQSAIIITYDESDGFYDHVPPRILSYGPDSLPLSRGIRVPLLVVSPFSRVHAVSHAEGDHNAVIETINAIFDLPALSSLPDEAAALRAGNSEAFNKFGPPGFQQKYLGPRDTNSSITDSLLSAFDPRRLRGTAPALPGSYAAIADNVVISLPHYGGHGCSAIGMIPEDQRQGIAAPPPVHFNPLAGTLKQYNSPAP